MNLSNKAKQIKPSSTLAITAKANQMKTEGIDVVGFGAGEPDFDTPNHIKEAAIAAIHAGFTKYTPVAGTVELKTAICKKFKEDNGLEYKPSQIVVSNGAKHSLTNAFMAILNAGDEVIIPAPFWLSYPDMVALADGVPVIIKTTEETNYKLTLEQLQNALTSKTKAIIVNSPSNPTGMVYSKEELQMIADFAVENDILVISDEIYEKLLYDDEKHYSIAQLGEEIFKRTIVVNGVSKSYSMTGWRIGYTASTEEIAKLMSNIQSHAASNPNSIAQKAAVAAIAGPQECVEVMRVEFDTRREYMVERVNAMPGISCKVPKGAFYVFINVSSVFGKSYNGTVINSASDFAACILEGQVAVIPCEDFGFDTHIRISYAISLESIKKGLDRLETFVESLV
ncbi:MAG: aspartate aminotransferase [Firmicutes bacterium HGW-Firmicutes-1]|jgi:aspartate aminotransferase|nr:MAG: aspartate aminotransferase [Firmicutes bacterium HGW-Firmicutes-1]